MNIKNKLFIDFVKHSWASLWNPNEEKIEELYTQYKNIVYQGNPADIKKYISDKTEYEQKLLLNACYDKGAHFLRVIPTIQALQAVMDNGYDITQRVGPDSEQKNNLEYSKNVVISKPRWRHKEAILYTFMQDGISQTRFDIIKYMVENGAQTDYNIAEDKKLWIEDFAKIRMKENAKLKNQLKGKEEIDFEDDEVYNAMLDILNGKYEFHPLAEKLKEVGLSHLKTVPPLEHQKDKTFFKQLIFAASDYTKINKNLTPDIESFTNDLLETWDILEKRQELPNVNHEVHKHFSPMTMFLDNNEVHYHIFNYLLSKNNNPHLIINDKMPHIEFSYCGSIIKHEVLVSSFFGAPEQTLLQYLALYNKKEQFDMMLDKYEHEVKHLERFKEELDKWVGEEKIPLYYFNQLSSYLEKAKLQSTIGKKYQVLPLDNPITLETVGAPQEKKRKLIKL